MLLRRVFVGTAVLFGLSVWSWCHNDGPQAHAGPPNEVRTATDADHADSAAHDAALRRYRTNQSRHWRHVMIGGR
jgi:hypothetical protein